jgi:triosephosphate isomerase (TIM)
MSQETPRRRIIGVSLKMYFTLSQTNTYIQSLLTLRALTSHDVEFFVVPDFLSLPNASTLLSTSTTSIRLGAQDCFWEDSGAFTGEVSPALLRSLGCSIVELGHAERRRLFKESDQHVALKAKAAERKGMTLWYVSAK